MPAVALSQLIGQPDVTAFLRGIVGRGRYSNAYLFHGPAGVGKGTAALAFARAALCDRVRGAAPSAPPEASLFSDALAAPAAGTGDDACGECPACIKSAALMHPDLKFLFPVTGEERTLESTVIPEILQDWRDDPFYTFQYDKAASVRLSQTRELMRGLAYMTYEASRRVVVIRDCDRMREDQYSALLKSVEEPAASTLWVLTTSRVSRVPATIRSRCQRVRFAPLSEPVIREFLITRAGVPEGAAGTLAALSAGSLARAIATRGAKVEEQRDKAMAMLALVERGNPGALWSAVQAAMPFGRVNREELRRTIEYVQLYLRDVIRVRCGAGGDELVNRGGAIEAAIRRDAASIDASEIRRRLMVLEEALRSIDGNISPDLTLFSTLARVGGSRMGEGRWPAHSTARWDY